jgi:hypothetical protein
MDGLPDIHDGFFDGLWISENKSVHLFLRTYAGERSTVVLKDVERMSVSNFLEGNILFDLVLVQPERLTVALIEQLYQPAQAETAHDLLTRAQQRGLSALVINPSYGAEGVVLFQVAEIIPNHVLPHSTAAIST